VTIPTTHPAYDPACAWCRLGNEPVTATTAGATAAVRFPAARRWAALAAVFVVAAFVAGLIAGLR
jgi:hypothetical protein